MKLLDLYTRYDNHSTNIALEKVLNWITYYLHCLLIISQLMTWNQDQKKRFHFLLDNDVKQYRNVISNFFIVFQVCIFLTSFWSSLSDDFEELFSIQVCHKILTDFNHNICMNGMQNNNSYCIILLDVFFTGIWILISDKDDKNAPEDCSETEGFTKHLCNVDNI